eukprot:CAMPEP_0119373158 /NCGR_PEP_ID=MMETSP1334-20130426/23665_1 /TAXON_ID=127549 /ORGANISM="Calcidiscus leptoporus, Strain RCC1130" /LENGTH=1062 /DNA_ID=CAMNT_0007390837 /DNA_START=170 /DNA_END=3358 /DNA_ORIENTATION=+
MGCCASQEEVEAGPTYEEAPVSVPQPEQSEVKEKIAEVETLQIDETKPTETTFIASVLRARQDHATDAAIMIDCCLRLQKHNRKLKNYVAIADAQAINEAKDEGWIGQCNDKKLIAVLCSRTKSQLQRTVKSYFQLYDADLRKVVKGETGGDYGRMMFYAMSSRESYVSDVIDVSCSGIGCNEQALVDLFVMLGQARLYAGKKVWEDKHDKSLIDYLNKELGYMYRHLRDLILRLLKDPQDEEGEVDEEKCVEQMEMFREETQKWAILAQDFNEELVSETISTNSIAANQRVALLYENKYNQSLVYALDGKCGKRFMKCLKGLLLTREDYIAMRLEECFKGWFTDKTILVRFLGGLDGDLMLGVAAAYERKYQRPLDHAVRNEISGEGYMERAALTWLNALNEPSRGAEEFTEVEVDSHGEDTDALCRMCDMLLVENDSLLRFIVTLDVEEIRAAVKGFGTDDTRLIRSLATRNKQFLARVSVAYRQAYGEPLQKLIDEECSGFYAFLAKFLVVQEPQADSMLLSLALASEAETDVKALIEFLCARHPARVRAVKKKWEAANDMSLIDKLHDSLTGDMRLLAITMLKGKRDVDDEEDKVDEKLVRKQAKSLYEHVVEGNEVGPTIDILCSNSIAMNKALAAHFEETYDMSLGRALGGTFSGNVKNALLALLQGPAQWYAASLRAAFMGAGQADNSVCRILGAHDKSDVQEIATAYERKYDVPLKADLSKYCKGNYKRLAVAWVDLPDQLEQPTRKIELPDTESLKQEAERAAGKERSEADDDLDDDDEDVSNIPKPSSPLYKAKVRKWTRKLNQANEAGAVYKAAYYRRLLISYPPCPPGNALLIGYVEALQAEFVNGDAGIVKEWLESVDDSEVGDDEGEVKSKAVFEEWVAVTTAMVADDKVSVKEMKAQWSKERETKSDVSIGKGKYEEPEYTPQYVVQPTPAAAQPPPQPGGVQLTATVPYGVFGGQQMQVTAPNGQTLQVTVPQGLVAGNTFTFLAPGGGAAQATPVVAPPIYQPAPQPVPQVVFPPPQPNYQFQYQAPPQPQVVYHHHGGFGGGFW